MLKNVQHINHYKCKTFFTTIHFCLFSAHMLPAKDEAKKVIEEPTKEEHNYYLVPSLHQILDMGN